MQIRPLASLALAALASAPMFSSTAEAVALGNVAAQSSLGQPLRVVIPVALVEGETLNTACLRLVGDGSQDGSLQLLAGRINFDRNGGSPRIVVTTARPVSEPAMKLSVQAGCGSTVRRDYALLFDPPELDRTSAVVSANADEFAQYTRGHRPVAVASVRRTEARPPAAPAAPSAPVIAFADHSSKLVDRPAKPAPALAAPEPATSHELVAFVADTGTGGLISEAGAQSLPRVAVKSSRPNGQPEAAATSILETTWPYTAGGLGVMVLGLTAFTLRRRMFQHPVWTSSASRGEPMHASSRAAAPPVTFAHFGVMTEPALITPRANHDFPQLADITTTEDGSLDTLLGDIASEVIDERAVREAWKNAATEDSVDIGTDSILKAIAAAERDLQLGPHGSERTPMDIALEDDLLRDAPRRNGGR